MSFISFEFIIVFLLSSIVYWIFPKKIRWILLLIGSVVFYCFAGWENIIYLLITSLIVFFIAIRIEYFYTSSKYENLSKDEKKKRAKEYLLIGTASALSLLIYFKIGKNLLATVLRNNNLNISESSSFVVPLGVSYYTFSVIGYLTDVYWQKDSSERNFFKFLLYMIYFPQILQGPIPRHKRLTAELFSIKSFDYKSFCFGLQRAIWGYFKKLVIADRFGIISRTIFADIDKYGGQYIIVAVLAATVNLYCDFSGCMDIALGISESLGVKLDENFQRPFYSRTSSEFWRRWHITLGTWFKDYVYMPLVINPRLLRISKKIKDKYGIRAGKNFMTVVPLSIVWILTGLWHGTGVDYFLWGIYWGIIIILSSVLAPEIKKLNHKLKIKTETSGWRAFQMFRTFIIFCGARLITAPGNINSSIDAFKSLFSTWNPWIWIDQSLYKLGLNRSNFWLGIIALTFMFSASVLQERGVHLRESISKLFLPIRWIVYLVAIFSVLIFGMYGPGYDASKFIYMNF